MELLMAIFTVAKLLHLASGKCHFDINKHICPCWKDESSTTKGMLQECSTWCETEGAVSYKVLDLNKGKVCISFSFPPAYCNHVIYEVKLFVDEGNNSCSDFKLHTNYKEITVSSSGCYKCNKTLDIDFDFLFTGCYQLRIRPFVETGSRQECFSKTFSVETDYKKKFVGNEIPTFTPYIIDNFVRVRWIMLIGDGLDTFSSFGAFLCPCKSIDCWCRCDNSEVQCAQIIPNHYAVSNNHFFGEPDNSQCNCKWETSLLECDFYDIPPGNYVIVLKAHDVRCTNAEVWSDTEGERCSWEFNYNVNYIPSSHLAPSESKPLLATKDYIIIGAVSVCIFIVLCMAIWKKSELSNHIKRVCTRQNTDYSAVSQITEIKVINSKMKILLLYPRDCQPFMEVMKRFRGVLNNTGGLEVYDMWDEDRYNEVASIVTRWGLSLLMDKDCKVILVANPCSRLFEMSVLQSSSKKQITYRQHDSFDGIFPNLLHSLITHNDPYNKIFVVRLESEDFKENVFQFISTCRAFTIPSQIKCLLTLIFGENPTTTIINVNNDLEEFDQLNKLILEYSSYREKNPTYLEELLNTKSLVKKL